MWSWIVPYERSSLRSGKNKDALIQELREVVYLHRHWFLALIDGPAGALVGDLSGDRFNLAQKWIVGSGGYFPLARVIVREADGGSVLEIRYSSPPFYVVLAAIVLIELRLVLHHEWEAAVLMPIGWSLAHVFLCLVYQNDKERMDSQIREIL